VCGSSAFSDPSSLLFGEEREALLEKLKCVEAKNPIFRPTAAEGAKILKSAHRAVEIRRAGILMARKFSDP
jgi:hypothetical protein